MTHQPAFPDSAEYLHIETLPADGRVRVSGELDSDSAPQLTAALAPFLAAHAPAVIELAVAEMSFIDAAGVRCLMACQEAAHKAGIQMVLRDPAPTIVRVLEALGLLDRFANADATPPHSRSEAEGGFEVWPELSARNRVSP